ncbi:hypothetical protein [Marinobacter salarius]|uniref:hypothetical protein n=1 Tax=Marinobacter salarius TaxID=1420917 RepID=UPI003D9C2252
MAKRIKIGDIVEIPVENGYAYAQYTHKNSEFGALLRVFSGVYPSRPSEPGALMDGNLQFSIFCLLQTSVNQGLLSIVGNASIAEPNQSFPLFRAGFVDPATRKVSKWWLWDGVEEWPVGKLTADQKKFPFREIANPAMIIYRVDNDWTPETDIRN